MRTLPPWGSPIYNIILFLRTKCKSKEGSDKEKNRTALINTVIEFTVLGIDVDKIASITGLTIDEIRAIRS